MHDLNNIRPAMRIVAADGIHIGTVDGMDGARIRLIPPDGADHRYLAVGLVIAVRGDTVCLAATAQNTRELFEEYD
ncbi:DUF2171 domain-containing protein [uncultured Sphingomonas sp.]|uniref:DUF2171 domain-containing protein n=1 Tax=uncultured Sphingomonas sp. TaxID=158754 RepID=UPI0026020646|nr:DUF2171 domain-containing protein [uncultured Sphingomonas sp.]